MARRLHGGVKQRREQRPRVLVLCEGCQTEPNYIGALIREYGLTAVSVPRNHRTDPIGLVREAIRELKNDRHISRVFVIIDRDEHESFDDAVNLARESPFHPDRLTLIRSYPSFEVWILYHFEYCRAPLSKEEILSRLKSVLPQYDKASAQCMDNIIELLDTALINSRKALADAIDTDEPNSSSEMHLLVDQFIAMAS